jgi:hypothetical protein
VEETSLEKLTFATQTQLRKSGKRSAAAVVFDVTSTTPTRAKKYRRSYETLKSGEYAEKNKIKHSFSKNMQSAGNDWLWGFIKRIKPNFSIYLRKPEKQVLTEFWHSTKMQ